MTRTPPDSPHPWIDTVEFARSGGHLEAVQPPAAFPRLRDLLAADDGSLGWQLDGERHTRPEGGSDDFLVLHLDGEVSLTCMRCLQPVRVRFGDHRQFKIAATESQAEREDAQTDDYDVIAASRRFDVHELVEDEAILALPIAPRHADCSLPGDAPAAPEPDAGTQRPNPFAMLAGFKPRSRGDGGDA